MNELSTSELMSRLRTLKVQLSSEGGRLRYSAPNGVVTPELKNELTARKAEILAFLEQARNAARPSPIVPVSRDGDLGLSFTQRRLWLLHELEPDSVAYNLPTFFRLRGDLDVNVLQRSIGEIVRRHEILRTYYVDADGQPVQRIAPPQGFDIPVIDLLSLPKPEREKEAARIAFEHANQPIDLTKAPVIRANLIRLGSEDYVLLLNVSHIAFDGVSFDILTKELSALYSAFKNGEPSPLAELEIQYADYAAWQRQCFEEDALQDDLAYWTENLRDCVRILELPTDHPRPALQSHHGKSVPFLLPKEVSEKLRALSQQEDVTLFVTLLAALKVLLYRSTGQTDILVGTPISNRNRTELESLIGFFVNTLVLRSDLSGNPSFRSLLNRVHETAVGAYAHQDLPFERVVEAVHPERDISRTPLFQVMFSILSKPAELELRGVQPCPVEFHNCGAQFDLSLSIIESGEDIGGAFSYNTDLFEESSIARMVEQYQTLLGSIVSEPAQEVHALALLSSAERDKLLVQWNATNREHASQLCTHESFELQGRRSPDAIAVEYEGRRLTYSELNERSETLARQLRTMGIGRDVLVAVCVERSLDLAVALLGVMKAGGAYLPLDLTFPADRLAFMLADSKPPVLVTQTRLLHRLPPHSCQILCVDKLGKSPGHSEPQAVGLDNLAYVLYTSGSTGQPKGVEISHRSLMNFLHSMRSEPGITTHDTLLSVTTLSFDIFGLELWLPLTSGAKVILVSPEVASDGKQLAKTIADCHATIMQATPSTWRLMLEAGWDGAKQLKVLCGGEVWSRELAERLLPKCASLWNMYGPTETTIWSAVQQIVDGSFVVVGRPIANTQFYVVDKYMQPVPIGVAGELLIGGSGLARGYLSRPELTAEKFIPNPFSGDPQSRLYRTGDLVRYRPDGTIDFLSRIDHQVKIRGYRIELGEIESALQQHPGIRTAVAIVREDHGEKQIVAYVVRTPESGLGVTELRQTLKAKLPEYMVPGAFVFLSSLPLTPNGKLDRKALPAPELTVIRAESSTDSPRDQLEIELTRLWENVLRVRPVGLNDDFFELGGHSFAAVRLMNEIRKLTGRNLPLAMLFQASTVNEFAAILRKDGWAPSWSSLVPVQTGGTKPALFLVHGAEGNVLLYRQLAKDLGADQPVYGFQSQGLSGDGSLHFSIEEMAAHYLAELLKFQPDGPYYVGGYCLGGIIAYEMAQQLSSMGKEVGLVAMLDTYNSNAADYSKLRGYALLHLAQNFYFHAVNALSVPASGRRAFFREKRSVALARFGVRVRGSMAALQKWKNSEVRSTYPHLLVTRANDLAALRYVPKPYAGRVAVIRSKGHFLGLESESLGWDQIIEALEVHEIPVYPRGMLVAPFCDSLARTLESCLAGAQKQDSVSYPTAVRKIAAAYD